MTTISHYIWLGGVRIAPQDADIVTSEDVALGIMDPKNPMSSWVICILEGSPPRIPTKKNHPNSKCSNAMKTFLKSFFCLKNTAT